jgi:transposase
MKVHELVSDDLWALVEPLLPPHPAQPKGGTRWLPDRPALCGIIFVLQTGMRWNDLPLELGCGSGATCGRRLRDWQAVGVWQRLHRAVLDALGGAGRIDWSRASLDSASVRAKRGARRPAGTRRIAANRAQSAMWWSSGPGSRWSRA